MPDNVGVRAVNCKACLKYAWRDTKYRWMIFAIVMAFVSLALWKCSQRYLPLPNSCYRTTHVITTDNPLNVRTSSQNPTTATIINITTTLPMTVDDMTTALDNRVSPETETSTTKTNTIIGAITQNYGTSSENATTEIDHTTNVANTSTELDNGTLLANTTSTTTTNTTLITPDKVNATSPENATTTTTNITTISTTHADASNVLLPQQPGTNGNHAMPTTNGAIVISNAASTTPIPRILSDPSNVTTFSPWNQSEINRNQITTTSTVTTGDATSVSKAATFTTAPNTTLVHTTLADTSDVTRQKQQEINRTHTISTSTTADISNVVTTPTTTPATITNRSVATRTTSKILQALMLHTDSPNSNLADNEINETDNNVNSPFKNKTIDKNDISNSENVTPQNDNLSKNVDSNNPCSLDPNDANTRKSGNKTKNKADDAEHDTITGDTTNTTATTKQSNNCTRSTSERDIPHTLETPCPLFDYYSREILIWMSFVFMTIGVLPYYSLVLVHCARRLCCKKRYQLSPTMRSAPNTNNRHRRRNPYGQNGRVTVAWR